MGRIASAGGESIRYFQNSIWTSPTGFVTLVYIMICTITIIVGLVWWALLLMEQANRQQEFSRMLAGMLVVAAAAGVLTVHVLMDDYIAFMRDSEILVQQAEFIASGQLP